MLILGKKERGAGQSRNNKKFLEKKPQHEVMLGGRHSSEDLKKQRGSKWKKVEFGDISMFRVFHYCA